jgi:hypothetical protein
VARSVQGRALRDGLETRKCPLGSPLKARTVEAGSPYRREAAEISSVQTLSFPFLFTFNRSLPLWFQPPSRLAPSEPRCLFLLDIGYRTCDRIRILRNKRNQCLLWFTISASMMEATRGNICGRVVT